MLGGVNSFRPVSSDRISLHHSDAMFVMDDSTSPAIINDYDPSASNSTIYGVSSSQGSSNSNGLVHNLSIIRPSSVVLLRPNDVDLNTRDMGSVIEEKASWWEEPQLDVHTMSSRDIFGYIIDSVLFLALPVLISFAAVYAKDSVLPFVYCVAVAFAGYEYVWLAYRVRLRIFLPFKLHQKRTCRDLYTQIMSYSVDLNTRAITPLAERVFCGHTILAAMVLGIVSGGIALVFALTFISLHNDADSVDNASILIAYIVMSVFLGVFSSALAPNLPAAIGLLIRFMYYFLSSLNVVQQLSTSSSSGASASNHSESGGEGGSENHAAHTSNQTLLTAHAVTLESFSLMFIAVCLLLINRVVTSKEPMESAVIVLLDIAGLIYISCFATVLEYFSKATVVESNRYVLVGFLVIVWSSELGSFLMERFLKWIQFPWNHPIAKRISSRQNVEKLSGALVCGVLTAYSIADSVDFQMKPHFVALLTGVAILFSQVCKLLLMSLKKIAKVSTTGEYLRIGGGFLDRIDTVLFMAIVFCPFVQ